jgi:hypothetical protein
MLDLNELDQLKLTGTAEQTIFDFEKMFHECLIDLDIVYDTPPTAISIGQYEFEGKFFDNHVYTFGEFSATVAPSKTKKSFFKSALISCFIGGKSREYFPNIKSHRNSNDDIIIDIDTEQGKFYAQRVFRRVQIMTGMRYPNYYPFAMRSKTPQERVNFVDALLQQPKFKGKVKFISIDGIADLVENTNDIVMSSEIASKVLKWTDEQGIHLHTVIHKLSNAQKGVGHLGSYILKKAETVVFLEQDENDKEVINVNHIYARGISFSDFSFSVNKQGIPYEIDNSKGDKLPNNKAVSNAKF